jgi:hypothetical protein
VTTIHPSFEVAERLAPVPYDPGQSTRDAWIRHFAALGLAAHVAFRAALGRLSDGPKEDWRPDLGYLAEIGVAATAAAAALVADSPEEAPSLIYSLTPEAGALNGEWMDWLYDVLEARGINPAHIDPNLNATDFDPTLPVASEQQ